MKILAQITDPVMIWANIYLAKNLIDLLIRFNYDLIGVGVT